MNQSFDKQIFGQVVEVIRPQTPSLSTIKANPLSSFMSSSIHSEQNYSNSSFRPQKHGDEKGHKKLPDALTNYTDNGSVRKSGGDLKGLRKNRTIENSNAVQDKSISQVNIKKLTKNDNFYCMCCEKEQKNQNCIACQGAGSADGTNNIVKFIEYIMQFKLGIKQSYKNTKSSIKVVPNRCQLQRQEESTAQSKSSKNINKQMPNNEDKRIKKTISLSNKNPVTLATSTVASSQPNRINQFCSEFIKSLPCEESVPQTRDLKQSNFYNPSDQKLKLTQSTYRTNSNLSNNSKSMAYNEENNVSSINVGINGMTESIIDDSLNERPEKYVFTEPRNQLPDRESIGLYYGYESLQNTVKSPATSSVLLVSKKTPNVCANRQSIPEKQTLNLSEMREKLSLQNTVHNGFSCNQCEIEPIRGTRYHCTSFMCEDDYDLCEECYIKYGHKHNMLEIRGRNLEKICEGLQQCSSKSIRYSTRMSVGGYGYGETQERVGENRSNYSNMIFKSSIH